MTGGPSTAVVEGVGDHGCEYMRAEGLIAKVPKPPRQPRSAVYDELYGLYRELYPVSAPRGRPAGSGGGGSV